MADNPSQTAAYCKTYKYCVIVKDHADLDTIYSELETAGLAPPGTEITRDVQCIERKPLSRGTIYKMTEWEAEQLRNDPRIKAVELHPAELGVQPGLNTTEQTSSAWDKSGSTGSTMKNFALLRCTEGVQREGWGGTGYEGTAPGSTPSVTGTIQLTQIGRNVDCVIVDENGIVWNHPEYNSNEDGSSGSNRTNQYNWFQHDQAVRGISPSAYSYGTGSHSTHVSGTVAGNTQGWARGANIYNIYYDAGNAYPTFEYVMDYVRQFHSTKSVNGATGRKNPTICNNSWGMSIFPGEWSFSDITAVTYRGTRYQAPGGSTSYTGFSGVCTASTRLATMINFENAGNRITTTGTVDQADSRIVSSPAAWTRINNYSAQFSATTQPANSYTVTVATDTANAQMTFDMDVSAGGSSGVTTLTTSVTVRLNDSTVVETFTVGPTASTDGGIATNLIDETVTLATVGTYTITYATTISNNDVSNRTYAWNMGISIPTDATIVDAATVTSLASSLLGEGSLTSSTTPTSGNNDDGYWTLTPPWNVNFIGTDYSTIYVGTNHYVTFGEGSNQYSSMSASNPPLPKIMHSAADNSVQRIYYGTEGTAPNRTYRVRTEGNAAVSGTLGAPGMVMEWTFYENNKKQIDLQVGVNNRKTVSGGGFDTPTLNGYGFIAGQRIPVRVALLDADLEDAYDEGIIMVGAAGNGRWKHEAPGGADWNNTFEMANRYPASVATPYYYMRGTSPTAMDNTTYGNYDLPAITVGAVDSIHPDQKVLFSDCGAACTIWAPGTYIVSSLPSGIAEARAPGGTTYYVGKYSGTSMASPQVCGVIACALETYPEMNQEAAKAYITAIAKADQLTVSGSTPTDGQNLQGAPNLYLFYRKEREATGSVFPKINFKIRPSTGTVWPRPRVKRTLN